MKESFCGYISIVGKPNVGKSTILNHILGKKVSITSRKSQTTRNNILGIKTVDNKQMIFADTPGMHIKSPKVMNKVLNRSAESLIEDSDIILFVVLEEDKDNLKKVEDRKRFLICTKNRQTETTFREEITKYDYKYKSNQPIEVVFESDDSKLPI